MPGVDHVTLLGSPRLATSSESIRFLPDLRFQLLAYLAHAGDWVSREQVAFLFWPDSDSSAARKNLSQLLKRLRRFDWLDGLEGDAQALRWPVATDVAAFRAALAEGAWEEARTGYGGTFLEGFGRDLNPEYEAWLEHEREHLHGRWREAVFRRAEELEDAGGPAAAASTLAVLVEKDPFDEEGLRAYLETAARAGQAARALKAYRAFAATLHEELGMEPSLATLELVGRLEEATGPAVPVRETPAVSVLEAPAPSRLPMAGTPFVGRDLELAEIAHRLSQPDCRLVTITGPGGAGKSRLALQAAEELAPGYPDGVAFVPLEALTAAEQVPGAVGAALELDLSGPGEPLRQVSAFLRGKRVLLLLDNAEHLADAATVIPELLETCPELACLVTSRERLGLREEWLLPLTGLSYPASDTLPLADAERFDAVKLFLHRSRQVRPGFRLDEGDLGAVLELCRLTQGLPLALELAAAWMRAMTCEEIAREVARDVDVLSSRTRDVPDRHRSIRAVFEGSWALLSPKEQDVLARLSAFRGGFRRDAAAVVADASIAVLAALVDKSLLRMADDGRYDRHPLLYQYTREKLAERAEEQARSEEKHARYFLDFLLRHYPALKGSRSEQQEALRAVTEEFENLRLAWGTAVARRWSRHLSRMVEPLERFLQRQGHVQDLIDLFASGVAGFAEEPEHAPVLGLLLAKQGWYAQRSGDYDEAIALSERSLELLRQLGPSRGLGQALNTLGFVANHQGRFDEARRYLEDALEVAAAVGDPWYIAGFGNNLAIVEVKLGNYAAAEALYRQTLALNRRSNDTSEVVINLLNFGTLTATLGKLESAEEMLLEALSLAREIGFTDIQPFLLATISNVGFELGDLGQARTYSLQALDLFRAASDLDLGSRMHLFSADCLNNLGRIELQLGDVEQARVHFEEALSIAWSVPNPPIVLGILVNLARLRVAQGRVEEAVQVLACVLTRPALEKMARDGTQALLDALEGELEASAFQAAVAHGQALELDEVVQSFLLKLPPPLGGRGPG